MNVMKQLCITLKVKKIQWLVVWLMGIMLLPVQTVYSQPALDFGSGELTPLSVSATPVIRTLSPTSAVASKNGADNATLYLIDVLTLNVHQVELDIYTYVFDMRVLNDAIYFCGKRNGRGFVARMKISEFYGTGNAQVDYNQIDNVPGITFYRMAAYPNNIAGSDKIVAVGEYIYWNQDPHPGFPCCKANATDTGLCISRIVFETECTGGVFASGYYAKTDTIGHLDCIEEVIETDNYLALVGYYTDQDAISIHRCDKYNVLNTFGSNWYYYPITAGFIEGASKYKGCHTQRDTIAIASIAMYTDALGEHFGSMVRTFDLASWNNTTSQFVKANIKQEPKEMIYFPTKYILVLLQDIYYSSLTRDFCSFINLEPYGSGSYSASTWFHPNPTGGEYLYASLDRLGSDHYVASGGNYWCLKDAWTFNSSSINSCYKRESVSVLKTDMLPKFINSWHVVKRQGIVTNDTCPRRTVGLNVPCTVSY